ncbi:phospholipid N-methyltransferase [Pseudonocardia hierapolitana]|uniref:Phospholipid N-methyltransferase n=1 Tax=Pseudonocardia hierapolitana TaxID=1128676 RepID=A0A561T1D8_9PSEU|nr:methyltransferase domain-containing protein [Pseudonocardia hierapolitana]TWF80920.1 phospholipid N-methyltransferase [Pseudonocardia hierapolitana]
MGDGRVLFQEFLRAPTRVATVTASSNALVDALLAPHRLDGSPTVVELGAGTGRVTDALQHRLSGTGRHLAVEINPVLADRLATRHPAVTVVCADAARLPDVLREHGIDRVDAIVSLLPWAAYAVVPVPAMAARALAPSGTFTQATLRGFHLLPPARRQARDLRAAFGTLTASPTIWQNLPPARVLIAREPRSAAS